MIMVATFLNVHSTQRILAAEYEHCLMQTDFDVARCDMQDCSRYAKEGALCLVHARQTLNHQKILQAMNLHSNNSSQPRLQREEEISKTLQQPSARCRHPGCTSYARNRGHCSKHGGGRKCMIESCMTPSQTGGLCRIHGGGTRCKMEGCEKFARVRGCCSSHIKHKRQYDTETSLPSTVSNKR